MVGLSQMFTPKGLGEQVKDYVEKNQKGDNKLKVGRCLGIQEANDLLISTLSQ